jgi:hypothetical protein
MVSIFTGTGKFDISEHPLPFNIVIYADDPVCVLVQAKKMQPLQKGIAGDYSKKYKESFVNNFVKSSGGTGLLNKKP